MDYGSDAEGHAPNVIAKSHKSGRLWSLKVLRNTDAVAQAEEDGSNPSPNPDPGARLSPSPSSNPSPNPNQAEEEGLPLLLGAGVSGYKCVHEAQQPQP